MKSILEKRAYDRDRQKRWAMENPQKIKEIRARTRNRNREKRRLYSLMYNAKHRERLNAKAKAYNQNPEIKSARSHYNKSYSDKNRSRLKIYRLERQKRKLATDRLFAIRHRLRVRLRHALNRQGRGCGLKAASVLELVGCDKRTLLDHIEKQFRDGMTWDNRSLWHVDHILPCASFDLSDPQQQRECFHYTNLQPLWSVENIRKGAKVISVDTVTPPLLLNVASV